MANSTQFDTYPGEANSFASSCVAQQGSGEPDQARPDTVDSASNLEDTFVFPASREQTRYWMLAQLDPQSTASNMAIAFEIEGEVVDSIVEQAIAALTMRHEALRTVFRLEGGILSQVVLSRPLYRFTVEDLRDFDPQEQPAALEISVSRHGHTVINLEAGPVLHAHLVHLAASRHVMALTMNHIVCDGWSNGILIRDFTLIYEALLAGKNAEAARLPELPFQFADFSLWQNEYLASPAADEAAAFWKQHITSDLSALDLPTDEPRPPGRSFPGHIESQLLPKAIDEQLKQYCRQTGSTKHIVLLAAFEALCATYTGQREFLLGSTIANRTQPGMEDVVGRFANPQIIVAKVNGDPTFTQLEQRVRDWETAAYTHQDLPFSRIIEDFQIDQAGATSQFLQVWFLYQKAFMQPQTGETIRVTPRRSVSGGVDFDLLVSVVERAEGPRIQFEYNTLIFEQARIRGLIDRFIQLLGEALEQPGLPLSHLARGTASVAISALDLPSGIQSEPSKADAGSLLAGSFLSTFAEHLESRPQAIAIADAHRQISWRELEEKSAWLAGWLQQKHPSCSTLAIHLARRPESLVALIAALKLGLDIVPLPAQTDAAAAARCMGGLSDALLLATEEVAGPAGIAFETFTSLDQTAQQPGTPTEQPVPAERDASFHFLSNAKNTTFVEAKASAVYQTVAAAAAALKISQETSLLCFSPSTPLDACLDLLLAVVSGAQLNFAEESAIHLTDGALASQIERYEVSCILATPETTKAILTSGWPGDRRVALVVRGGRLPAPLAPMLGLRLKSAVFALTSPQARGFAAIQSLHGRTGHGLQPIGAGSLLLTDAEGREVPAGAFGEVSVQSGPEDTLLHTGYMARSSSTGAIELLDHAERFVQLRGHRVCLGEIEDAVFPILSIHSAYASATDTDTDARLALYLVAGEEDRNAASLRQHFRDTVASHMAPSDFVWLDRLPLASDGKLDLREIPKYEQRVQVDASETAAAPWNDVQQRLAAIWKDVLGVKAIDIHQTFFELGGSSLLLVRLFARINKAFGSSLPITTIFDAQTIEALAIMLGGGTEISHLVQVQTGGSKPPLFMVHSYLLYQGLSKSLGPDQPFYGLRELDNDGHLKIEERVKRYVAEIRKVQPSGPYHLAGWCAAGPLTVEVARHLLHSGEEVNYLALFDSWLPSYFDLVEAVNASRRWQRLRKVNNKLAYHKSRLHGLAWSQKALYLWMNLSRLSKETRYRIYMRNWERIHRLSEKYHFTLPQFMHNTSFQTFSALKDYQGEGMPVRVTLIRASDSREVVGAIASCGWEQIAQKGVEVLWAPGDHESMFRGANLEVTSEMVRRGLEVAAAGQRPTPTATDESQSAKRSQQLGVLHVDCPSS